MEDLKQRQPLADTTPSMTKSAPVQEAKSKTISVALDDLDDILNADLQPQSKSTVVGNQTKPLLLNSTPKPATISHRSAASTTDKPAKVPRKPTNSEENELDALLSMGDTSKRKDSKLLDNYRGKLY
jgi:hypothetical protein